MFSLLVSLLCVSIVAAIPSVPSLPFEMGFRTYELGLNLRKFEVDTYSRNRLQWFVRAAVDSLDFVHFEEEFEDLFGRYGYFNDVQTVVAFDTKNHDLKKANIAFSQIVDGGCDASLTNNLFFGFDNLDSARKFEAIKDVDSLVGEFLTGSLADGAKPTYWGHEDTEGCTEPTILKDIFDSFPDVFTAYFVQHYPDIPAATPVYPISGPFLTTNSAAKQGIVTDASEFEFSGFEDPNIFTIDASIEAFFCREHPHHREASAFHSALRFNVGGIGYYSKASGAELTSGSPARFYNQVDAFVHAVHKLMAHAGWADDKQPAAFDSIFYSNCV